MRIPLVILFIFYFSNSILAQNQSHSSSAVTEFFNFLDNFRKDYDGKTGLTKNYSKEEVFEFAKKYYKAIAEDPVGYNKYVLIEYNEYGNKRKTGINPDEISPPLKRGIFLSLPREKLGKEFTELLGIPYFLRINIKEITHSIYISSTDSMKFGQTNLLCEIEDVIKGTNRFKPNDTILVIFLNRWRRDCKNNFEINKSYFLPLIVRQCNIDTCKSITLQTLPDNNCGLYPIVDKFIETPGNYFGNGEISKWEDFRNHFVGNYVNWFN